MKLTLIACAVIAIGLLALPFGLTAFTATSICFSQARIVGADEKIASATRWLQERRHPFVSRSDCCEVSKGANTFPSLGFGAYLLSGKAHYVFVPKTPDAQIVNGKHRPEHWNVVTVGGCGEPLAEGVDL
jgi:hypothetical protein